MKFTIRKDDILPALSAASAVAQNRAALPILQNILIEDPAIGPTGKLHVNASDGDCHLRVETGVDWPKDAAPFRVALLAKQLLAIFRDLPGEEADFSSDPQHNASISAGASRYRIPGADPTAFPSRPQIDPNDNDGFAVPREALCTLLRSVAHSAMTGTARPLLSSVCLKREPGGRLTAVATDSRRLAVAGWMPKEEDAAPGQSAVETIIPLKFVNLLLSMLPGEGDVQVATDAKLAQFAFGPFLLTVKKLEGKYPNWRQIIPEESKTVATIEREPFLAAIRRVTAAMMGQTSTVKLQFCGGTLTVSSSGQTGDASDTIPVKQDGPDIGICFNGSYLADPLKASTQDAVVFKFIDSMNPGMMEAGFLRYVVMPIRE